MRSIATRDVVWPWPSAKGHLVKWLTAYRYVAVMLAVDTDVPCAYFFRRGLLLHAAWSGTAYCNLCHGHTPLVRFCWPKETHESAHESAPMAWSNAAYCYSRRGRSAWRSRTLSICYGGSIAKWLTVSATGLSISFLVAHLKPHTVRTHTPLPIADAQGRRPVLLLDTLLEPLRLKV